MSNLLLCIPWLGPLYMNMGTVQWSVANGWAPQNYDVQINDIFIWPHYATFNTPTRALHPGTRIRVLINIKLFDVFLHTKEIFYNNIIFCLNEKVYQPTTKKEKKKMEINMAEIQRDVVVFGFSCFSFFL